MSRMRLVPSQESEISALSSIAVTGAAASVCTEAGASCRDVSVDRGGENRCMITPATTSTTTAAAAAGASTTTAAAAAAGGASTTTTAAGAAVDMDTGVTSDAAKASPLPPISPAAPDLVGMPFAAWCTTKITSRLYTYSLNFPHSHGLQLTGPRVTRNRDNRTAVFATRTEAGAKHVRIFCFSFKTFHFYT